MSTTTGNLTHSPTNDHRFQDLLDATEQLGGIVGQSEDVQIKHLLLVAQAAFEGVIDNTENKHGQGHDDATRITEAYWNARNKNVKFNPRAGNQRKTISCVRQVITLGGWSKGGPGEPMGLINNSMSHWLKLRQDPPQAKRMIDAANYLVLIARRMKRSDVLLTDDEVHELAFKKDPNLITVEDVLDSMRRALTKLQDGKHPAGQCSTSNIEAAKKAINKELKAIADAKRTIQADADWQQTGEEIAQEADRLAKADGAASASAT